MKILFWIAVGINMVIFTILILLLLDMNEITKELVDLLLTLSIKSG